MTGDVLIYGATGYTGKLIARVAHGRGLKPILAGRNAEKLKAVADPLGLEWRAFTLTNPGRVDAGLRDIAVVLCIAGPFSATSRPMADACMRQGVHYLDITGEVDVFEALAARDAEAKQAGVMLLPGVGFDVVPSDCVAAHLKRRLPDAVELKIYLSGSANVSRGTAKTMIEGISAGTRVRRDGRLVTLDRASTGSCDFGQGPRATMAIPMADVSTAFRSTGIPNIEVHFEAAPAVQALMGAPSIVKSFLGLPLVQGFLKLQTGFLPEGPSDVARQSGRAIVMGVARNDKGETVRCRLRTPDAYGLTAMTATDIARRVAAGEFRPGFQTPSLVYGADYILGFEGVTREDLNA